MHTWLHYLLCKMMVLELVVNGLMIVVLCDFCAFLKW